MTTLGETDGTVPWHSSQLWVEHDVKENMITATMSSVFGALLCVCVAVLAVTRSCAAALTTVVVVCATMLAVSLVYALAGWPAGLIEALAVAVLLGYAATFCIHISHAFVEARRERRNTAIECARLALVRLGPATISSAVTTAAASSLLCFAITTAFVQFGIVLMWTTFFALIGALVVIPAALASLGSCRDHNFDDGRSDSASPTPPVSPRTLRSKP